MTAIKMHFDYTYDYDGKEILVKVYDHGTDWQIVSEKGERWYTKHFELIEQDKLTGSQSMLLACDQYTSEFKLTCLGFEYPGCSKK